MTKIEKLFRIFANWLIIWLAKFKYLVRKYWLGQFILVVMINITFPDGSVKAFEKGVTGYEIAQSISPRLAEEVLAVSVKFASDKTIGKGKTQDLNMPINEDADTSTNGNISGTPTGQDIREVSSRCRLQRKTTPTAAG